ncbi:type VI secretion system-associated protein TagF [Corallincola platygyrae]
MAVSREQLNENWLEYYLSSPIWHFSFSAGVLGDNAVVGTMMPSVDGAGRHYPLSVVAQVEGRPPCYWLNSNWVQATTKKLLTALSEDMTFDAWQDFSQLNEQITEEFDAIVSLQKNGKRKRQQGYFLSHPNKGDAATVLADYLAGSHSLYCMWWTEGSELVEPCLMVTEGLPKFSQFSAMFDGQWQSRGWL